MRFLDALIQVLIGMLFSILGAFFVFLPLMLSNTINSQQWPYPIKTITQSNVFLSVSLRNIDPVKGEFTYEITDIEPSDTQNNVCISQLFIIYNIRLVEKEKPVGISRTPLHIPSTATSGMKSVEFDRSMCFGSNVERPSADYEREFMIPIETNRYAYPSDYIDILLHTNTSRPLALNEYEQYLRNSPQIDWSLDFPGWEVEKISSSAPYLAVRLVRPLIYRVLTPVLLMSSLLFICLIPFIKDIGAVCQSGIGLIVSIWAIRQIIVPPEIQWATLIDPACMLLYIALAISVLIGILRLWFFTPKPLAPPDIPLQDGAIEISPTIPPSPAQKSPARAYTTLLLGLAILGFILRSVSNRSNDKNR